MSDNTNEEVRNEQEEDKITAAIVNLKAKGAEGEDAIAKLLVYTYDTDQQVDALVDNGVYNARWNGINLIINKQCITRGWYLIIPNDSTSGHFKRPTRLNTLKDVKRFYDILSADVVTPEVEEKEPYLSYNGEIVDDVLEYVDGMELKFDANGSDITVDNWTSSSEYIEVTEAGALSIASTVADKAFLGNVEITATLSNGNKLVANVLINNNVTYTVTKNEEDVVTDKQLSDFDTIGGTVRKRSIVLGEEAAVIPFVSSDKIITFDFSINADITTATTDTTTTTGE